MTTKLAQTLPKTLPGVVCVQWKRCGHTGCKCAHGDLHGPYYYRFWRESGKLRKTYIRRSDVALVQAACQERQREERAQRIERRIGQRAWRTLLAYLREIERDA